MKLAPPCSPPFAQFEMHNRRYLWRVSRKLAKTPRGKRPFPYIRLLWGFKSTITYSRAASIFRISRAKFTTRYYIIDFYKLEYQNCKIEAAFKKIGLQYCLIDTPYLLYLYYPFLLTKRRTLMMVKQPDSSISSCSHASVHHLPHLPLCNLPSFWGHPYILRIWLLYGPPFRKQPGQDTVQDPHLGKIKSEDIQDWNANKRLGRH